MRASLAALALALTLGASAEAADVVAGTGCPPGTNFEREGYTIRQARVVSPFSFLRFIRTALDDAQHDVALLEGRPYNFADVRAVAQKIEDLNFLPDALDLRVRVSLVVVSVSNCSDRELDLQYSVLSTQVAPVLSGTFESVRSEHGAPQRASGVDAEAGRFRAAPHAGYDRAEHLFGGGRVEYRLPGAWARAIALDSIAAEGRASDTMHEYSAELAGSTESPTDLVARLEWRLHYFNRFEPTADRFHLRQDRVAAQMSAITRPLGDWRLPVRFGGLIEGGRLESDFRAADLPADSVARTGYASGKFYVGTTTRLDRNVFAASYGVEVGSTSAGLGERWIKQVGDVAHSVALPVGDHRALTIESRLSAGLLQAPGTVPVNVRFFGGTHEQPFIPGDAWTIRSNPVIRSIPANRFSRTNEGAGGTHFASFNLTAAVPIWRKPVVPSELSRDPEFRPLLDTQLNSATSLIQTDFASRDTHFQSVVGKLADVEDVLAKLKAAVDVAKAARPGQLEDLFKDCATQLRVAERRLKAALGAKGGSQLGNVGALLSVDPDEDRLRRVRVACVELLNRDLRDAEIAAQGARLETIRQDMEREFALIDQKAAASRAQSEMVYVRRTLNTLIDDLNIISVSPVLMLDAAHLGPADSRLGTRYGVGGGLRLTLANSIDFTAGYLANPKRLRGEPSGAFFFSMQFKDLLD